MNILYLAKPTYGGWVTFTAHLSIASNSPVYKVSKKLEKGYRNFGYGVKYQNIPAEAISTLGTDTLVAAVDASGHEFLEKVKDGATLIIHDPTELKEGLVKHLHRFNIVCIRRTVQKILKDTYKIDAGFMYHPYCFEEKEFEVNRKGSVAISRIDFDKHTDIILDANKTLKDPIEIYGKANTMYVYHKLDREAFKKHYKGSFPKDVGFVSNLLKDKKFMVDMSVIKNDGGGTQYTFLEAIENGAVLVLNKGWFQNDAHTLIPGLNCLTASNGEELAEIIEKTDEVSLGKIRDNAREILKMHKFTGLPLKNND